MHGPGTPVPHGSPPRGGRATPTCPRPVRPRSGQRQVAGGRASGWAGVAPRWSQWANGGSGGRRASGPPCSPPRAPPHRPRAHLAPTAGGRAPWPCQAAPVPGPPALPPAPCISPRPSPPCSPPPRLPPLFPAPVLRPSCPPRVPPPRGRALRRPRSRGHHPAPRAARSRIITARGRRRHRGIESWVPARTPPGRGHPADPRARARRSAPVKPCALPSGAPRGRQARGARGHAGPGPRGAPAAAAAAGAGGRAGESRPPRRPPAVPARRSPPHRAVAAVFRQAPARAVGSAAASPGTWSAGRRPGRAEPPGWVEAGGKCGRRAAGPRVAVETRPLGGRVRPRVRWVPR